MAKIRSTRQHFTARQRAQIIQDYRQAQLSQKEFAAQAGIGVTTLQSWLRKAAGTTLATRVKFLPVPNLLTAPPARSTYCHRTVKRDPHGSKWGSLLKISDSPP